MGGTDSGYQPLITGSFTAISQNVDISSPNQSTEIIQISGTWVGTIVAEGSNNGTTYYPILELLASGLPITSMTANGIYTANTNGFQFIRLRSSAWTSGTATISVWGSDAASLNTNIDLIRGGTDGAIITNTSNAGKQGLDVNVINSTPITVGSADKSTFIYGSSIEMPVGGVYQDTSPSLTAGQTGALRSTSQRALHANLRDSNGKELGTNINPITVGYGPGTSDVFGNLIIGSRVNQIEVDFSKGTVASKLNISNSGGGTELIANGQGTFSSGTATTALSSGSSFYTILYNPGHEVYVEHSAAFTTPTNANSFQRIGLFDSNNGFGIGTNGLNFGIFKRNNGVDTHIVQASFNGDTLLGGSTSLFTRNGVPEALNINNLNIYRIRFGWLGAADIFFEILTPDNGWITFHKILQPNSSPSVSIQSTELPISIQVSKTSSDATNLIMTTACWASGSTEQKQIPTTPYGAVRVAGWGIPVFNENFDGADLDFENNWLLPTSNGTASYNTTGSSLNLITGTTASNAIHLSSIDTMISSIIAPVDVQFIVTLETTLLANTHRFWGVATEPASPTALLPLTDAIGWEITPAGILASVIYASGVKVYSKNLIAITDGLPHKYSLLVNSATTHFMIDSEEIALASAEKIYPNVINLPLHVHMINGLTGPSSSPTLKIMSVGVSDRSNNGAEVDSHNYALLTSSYAPDPGSHDDLGKSDLLLDNAGALITRSTILTDEGSFREDFSGASLLTTKTGTIQLVNGNTSVIGTGTLFTSEIKVGDYIKKVSDNEVNFSRVSYVSSDTRLLLDEGYTGTTSTGNTYTVSDWKTLTPTTGGGGMTLSNSILSMMPGTTNGNEVSLYRAGDYLPYNLIFNAAISQRIANQTITLGFIDDGNVLGVQANFLFDGTDNTKVKCVSAFSNAAGDTQTTVVTLPNTGNTSTYHTYEVDVTSQSVTFVIDGKVMAKNNLHVPSPYQVLQFECSVINLATVTATTLYLDMVYFADLDRIQISNDFLGDPLKASMMGISAVTGLPIDLNLDIYGNLIVSPLGGLGADFSFGDVNTSGTTIQPMRRTAYTEQTSNAQRSFASSSALDTAAGTGAQSLTLTYFTSTGAGPYLEMITLNGTTGVNTVATNICFIEHIEVTTAGSTGSNAGIITMYAAINKGGAVIGTINALDNQVFWCHHYVAINKICRIAGVSGATDLTSSAFVLLTIRAKPIGIIGATELQISDSFKLYGGASSAVRNYNSPISVVGPAKITMFATPGSNSAQNVFGAFDYSES